ncbi:zinc finger, CCHC-type containing protein [Tanacetum coccineum]
MACYLLNRVSNKRAIVRLPDLKKKTLGEKGIDCIFVGYAEHSKAYRDDHYDDVPSEIPEPCKGKRVQKAKSYGFDFQLVKGSRDHVGSQYSYCYSIQEDPRTYDEAMQSRDVSFWKEAIDDEIGSIIWVLSDLPPVARITTIRLLLALAAIHNLVIHQMDVKTAFLKGDLEEKVYMKQPEGFVMPDQNQVDKTKKFLSSRFSMKDRRYSCTPMDPVEKLKPNTGKPVDQLEYSRAIGCLMYVMTNTRPDIAYAVGTMNYGLSYVGYPSVLEAYSDASWINHVEDSSSTSGWVFLLGGGAISWASKKQTCITGSTMESEFVALAKKLDT